MRNKTDNHRRNLLVIKASAGSGKTYRLALEYIRHLLFTTAEDGVTLVPRRGAGDQRPLNTHRHLLAITFTNKATDEMKQRIVTELYNLSQPGVRSDYLEGFVNETGLDEGRVRELARLALSELLFDYSNFNVSTIDSFFQTILRNFARELDRDFNYDIQLEEDYAVRVAVHNFLLSLGKEGRPTPVDQWVKDYQRHLVHGDADKRKWKFFDDAGDLNKFAKQINSELFRGRMDDIRAYLGRIEEGRFVPDFSRIYQFQKAMKEVAEDCDNQVADNLSALRRELQPVSASLWKGRTFYNFLSKANDEPLSKKGWETIDDKKILNQFGKNKPDDAVIERLQQLMNEHFTLQEQAAFFKHIKDNLGLLGMLAMIDLFLEEYRHETNSILIGDTNELIGTVLDSGSDFVYERVGTMIFNFMIDEFQDTSAKQYENFKGLLKESLANGHFDMLIGDAKQSIYRFRNADPTVFRDRVGADFADDIDDDRASHSDDDDSAQGVDRPASTNYRSSSNIIDFNNSLFVFMRDQYIDRQAVVNTYADIVQAKPDGIDTDKVPGYVRLMTGNYSSLLHDDDIKSSLPPDLEVGPDSPVDVLTVLPGYLLQLHERYDWRKIGILVNKNKEGDKVVECILEYNKRTTGEKIRIVSGESLLLSNSPIIRRIIAMLRFIDISQFGADEEDADDAERDQEDDVARAIRRKRESDRRLYTSLGRFIKAVAANPDASPVDNGALLVQSLSTVDDAAPEGEEAADDLLQHLLPPAGELTTLVSIVETIIAHFKNEERGGADVDREAAFLLAFQDAVMQFASLRNGGSVREFLKYWDEKKGTLAVSSASNDDAIEIMSIHKAKGLEFDCVVIPFADWELDSNSRETNYWMPSEVFVDVLKSLHIDAGEQIENIMPPLLHVDKASIVALHKHGLLTGKASAFVSKQIDDVLIDNLNKTYVAMTRPRSELHVFAQGRENTVASPLAQFARDCGVMTPMALEPHWYELGEPPTRADFKALREAKKRKNALKPGRDSERQVSHERISGYTVNAILLKLRVKVDHASSPSIDAGLRLHSVLSRIHDRDDVDRAIDTALKHGVITADNPDDPCGINSVNTHVRGPILGADSRVAAWFDPANVVYSERTITSASDSLWDEDGIENLRPDRIVRRPNGQIIVIDYKSGERNDKRYLRQLNRYITKLRAIFPGTAIVGRLWYVTHDLIIDEAGKGVAVIA